MAKPIKIKEYIDKKIQEVSVGPTDLSNYYTKTQVDNLIPSVPTFKTINNQTITGTGNITITGGTSTGNSYTPSGW